MRAARAGRRAVTLAAVAATVGMALSAAPAAAQPTAGQPHVLDGPSADIASVNGMSIARDGSGGLAYVKNVAGTPHVFVSRLVNGVFQAADEVDAGLPGGSSQPVIAASNGGLLVIGFINSGSLYAVTRPSTNAAYTQPADLFNGASNPAISITTLGKAYIAFTAAGAGGHDVRAAYYDNGQWGVEASALDANPADDAGTGTGRPAVAAAGDGVAIVAWGEAGHVYTRRVWATSPSIVYEQPDVPSLGGWSEVAADEPAVATGGDSSYAAVAFHEVFGNGSQTQSRVLMQRLHGSVYDGLVQPDALTTPGPEGADQPQVDAGEYGEGFVISGRTASDQLVAMRLTGNESPSYIQRVDSLQNTAMPGGVLGAMGYHSTVIAWEQNPGLLGTPDIRIRYFDGANLDAEQVLSSPSMGPAEAAQGLVVAGDGAADAAVAWIQGTGAGTQLVTAQLYQPPGGFSATNSFQYVRSVQPTLTWSAPREPWGPVRYDVRVDGSLVAQTILAVSPQSRSRSRRARTPGS